MVKPTIEKELENQMKFTKEQKQYLWDNLHHLNNAVVDRFIVYLQEIEALKGQATIEIEKEWVECPVCDGSGKGVRYKARSGINMQIACQSCNSKGKIPKYKVGREIYYCLVCNGVVDKWHYEKSGEKLKLKIISETEDKQRLIMLKKGNAKGC